MIRNPSHTVPAHIGAEFQILCPVDALDALDLIRPGGFDCGVLVVLLDLHRRPIAGIAVDHAPSDELCAVAESIVRSVTGANGQVDPPPVWSVGSVVFGLVRETDTDPLLAEKGGLWLTSAELSAWRECQLLFAAHGIDATDLLVLEPSGWGSFREC
jgi:hypothetical protein